MRNILLVISGPSGVGKGTIVKELLKRDKNIKLSVSCTTRQPREGEKEGESYFFISKEQFEDMINRGEFLEYNSHFENYYGTPKKYVEESLKCGDVLLEIEVDGAFKVKKAHPEAILLLVCPPSDEELKRRLKGRGSESDEKISERLKRAKYELARADGYDYKVINDDLICAVKDIQKIIQAEKEK